MENLASLAAMKRVNLYFVMTHWRELQKISHETGAPVAEIVRRIIADHLKKRARKKSRVKERAA